MKRTVIIPFKTGVILISAVIIIAVVGGAIYIKSLQSRTPKNAQSHPSSNQSQPVAYQTANLANAPLKAQPLVITIATQDYQTCQKSLSNQPSSRISKQIVTSVDSVLPSTTDENAAPAIRLTSSCPNQPSTNYYLTIVGKYWKKVGQTTSGLVDCAVVDQYHLAKQLFSTGQCVAADGTNTDIVTP